MKYLNLVRWKNLLIITYIFLVIKFFLLDALSVPYYLDIFNYSILIFSVVAIAAAGYIINDINDIEIDRINKSTRVIIGKSISEDTAFNLYFALNILGIASGFYLAYKIDHTNFAFIHIGSSLLLYQYATSLKKKLLISNISVAFLSALSILTIIIFDLLPVIDSENIGLIKQVSILIAVYATFAFIVSLVREFVKDIEDYEGDIKHGVKSLAIVFSKKTSGLISAFTSISLGIFILIYSLQYLNTQLLSLGYVIIFVATPLLYTGFLLIRNKNESDITLSTKLIKFVMFTGISSIIVFTISLKYSNVI